MCTLSFAVLQSKDGSSLPGRDLPDVRPRSSGAEGLLLRAPLSPAARQHGDSPAKEVFGLGRCALQVCPHACLLTPSLVTGLGLSGVRPLIKKPSRHFQPLETF